LIFSVSLKYGYSDTHSATTAVYPRIISAKLSELRRESRRQAFIGLARARSMKALSAEEGLRRLA